MNVPPSARPTLTLDAAGHARLSRQEALLKSLARLGGVSQADAPPQGSAPFVVGEVSGALAIAGFIDVAGERARLGKEVAALDGEVKRFEGKLANESFVARAPAAVVEENRAKLADAVGAREKLVAALKRLETIG